MANDKVALEHLLVPQVGQINIILLIYKTHTILRLTFFTVDIILVRGTSAVFGKIS